MADGKMSRQGRKVAGLVLLVAGLAICGVVAQADVIYVDHSAGGGNNGTSWADAYTDLQTALGLAKSGDEIYVAAGVYYPGTTQTSSFALESGVGLYGGYPTGGGPRDVAAHVTVLSGDVDGDDAKDANGVTTTINGDNAYHVVNSVGVDETAILDGFTITGGDADSWGGGMYNHDSSSPTVTHCTFSNNHAADRGGAMYNHDWSSPTVENCTFSDNSADGDGGGMYNYNSSAPTVENCTFSGNTAGGSGGGMYNANSSPQVTGCTFRDNSADHGGGMYNSISSPRVEDCTFNDNNADGNGKGGGMYNDSSSPTVTDCTFNGNTGGDGGGMYNDSSSPRVENCTFNGNTASSNGGGMYNDSSSPTVTNCTFSGNTANDGGGMYNHDTSFTTVTNCTFSGNAANSGPGHGGITSHDSNTEIYDTILWGDGGGEIGSEYGTAPTAEYCVVQGGYKGTGNISADPLLGTLGNYGGPTQTIPIQAGSSALDAAVYPAGVTQPDTDQRGVTRPQGSACDIGAYENSLGDVNGDGTINILDVRLCLQIAEGIIQGTAAQRQQADVDEDGQVTLADAQLLADYVLGIKTP